MNRVRTIILFFSILSFTLIVNAQEYYDFYLQKARQRLAEGDCTRAEISYNSYKDIAQKTDKEIERLIEECKNGGFNAYSDEQTIISGFANGHEWIDLGLPSGTLWATCNVGASKPEGYGNYYAWGETSTKNTYNWSTYKYANGDYNKLTKYCSKPDYGNNGFTDNIKTLQPSDDAATANWGSGWQTPSKAQWEELLDYTTNQWTTRNGKSGRLFTSMKNGQSIFLPAAGSLWVGELHYAGSCGEYWSRSQLPDLSDLSLFAESLKFDSDNCDVVGRGRLGGFTVRPVRQK